ncbi:Synaptogenesis protein syg-2 [Eumeta japonica]|uniref:Synaptogenesis protein syg-2 n=1 Tax=Eumeta variegata TaxID=151549 RepID=A0A4C1X6G7_EUMVA|nr:Synaptogenesis protein syg-2 [Eumeta japonica]
MGPRYRAFFVYTAFVKWVKTILWSISNSPTMFYDARIESEWSSDTFDIDHRLVPHVQKNPAELTITKLTEEDQDLYHCRVDFLLSPTRNVGVNLTVTVLPRAPFIFDELNNKVDRTTGPHQEGDTLVLNCLVVGGRPPPHISWYSGESLVDESDGENEVPGVKENQLYLPLAREHAAPLTCRASNTKLVPPVSTTLHVELYLPVESVRISWSEGASNGTLRSGRRAVARCVARGSQPLPDVTWWLDHRHLTQHSNKVRLT